jgi:hypothetical protein
MVLIGQPARLIEPSGLMKCARTATTVSQSVPDRAPAEQPGLVASPLGRAHCQNCGRLVSSRTKPRFAYSARNETRRFVAEQHKRMGLVGGMLAGIERQPWKCTRAAER